MNLKLKIIQLINRLRNNFKTFLDNSNDKSSKKEYIILFFLIFIGCVIFTYTTLSPDKDKSNLNASMDVTKASNKNVKMSPKVNNISNINLTSFENPFVLIDNYQNVEDMSESAQARLAQNKSVTQSNLPIIPNYSGVNSYGQNNITLPDIPNLSTQSQNYNDNQTIIQGIMSDENNNKVAIVNGQVVKAGDSVNGNTISNISNSGITFNNGNKISYNIAK